MALFSFYAKTADGMDRNGTVEASDEKEAIKKLQQEGLIVVSLEAKDSLKGLSQLKDFLAFRKMIAPIIIRVTFWVGMGICVIGGIAGIFSGIVKMEEGLGDGLFVFLASVLLMIVGSLTVRLWCELLILFFRVNETLTEIKNNTEPRA